MNHVIPFSKNVTVGIQSDVLNTISTLPPASQHILVTALVSAYISGSNANSLYVASMPKSREVIRTVVTIDKIHLSQWLRIAKQISRGDVSLLVQAAMHQHLVAPEQRQRAA